MWQDKKASKMLVENVAKEKGALKKLMVDGGDNLWRDNLIFHFAELTQQHMYKWILYIKSQ